MITVRALGAWEDQGEGGSMADRMSTGLEGQGSTHFCVHIALNWTPRQRGSP